MGNVLSGKSKEPIDQLDVVTEKVENLENWYQALSEKRQVLTEAAMVYGVGFYVIIGVIIYIFYFPTNKTAQKLYYICYALYPLLIVVVKELIAIYFDLKMKTTAKKVVYLKQEKKRLMEALREVEPYRTFLTCLERMQKDPEGSGASNFVQQLKRLPSNHAQPARPPHKSIMDKICDYLIGDGTERRFALICFNCRSHNGMALEEEFEYIGFKCCYCNYYNPARKVRPVAPKLEKPEVEEESSEEEADGEGDKKATTVIPKHINKFTQNNT